MEKQQLTKSGTLVKQFRDAFSVWGSSIVLLLGFVYLMSFLYEQVFNWFPFWISYWQPNKAYYAIAAIIMAPLIEELLFRVIPIRLLKRITPDREVLWLFVGLISIIFGYLHGSVFNVLLQGTLGLMCSWLYIKHGNYWLNAGVHAAYNSFIYFGIPLLCQQMS